MKNWLVILLLSLVALPGQASVTMPGPSVVRDLLNRGLPNGFAARLGNQVVDKKVHVMVAKYRYRVAGGASVVTLTNGPTTFKANLQDADGNDAQLPINSVIKQVTVDVLANPVAYAGPENYSTVQLAVGINNAADLVGWSPPAAFRTRMVGKMNGSSVADYVKTTAESVVKLHQRGGSVIQGEFNVFIEYFLSD